jgi:hypothetical protein
MEDVEGVTVGTLNIIADESMRDIVEQEEEIFERIYKYAHLNIRYMSSHDVFQYFLEDSVRAIMTTRAMHPNELDYLYQQQALPRQYLFATGAIAFVANKQTKDTTYLYEEMISALKN